MELRMDKSTFGLHEESCIPRASKHIRVKYHFIKSCLNEGSAKGNYIMMQG